LEVVLPAIETLIKQVNGKHVVTADHGQALGERSFPIPMREWGHPPGVYIDELINVPWLEYQNNSRREIVMEPPTGSSAEEIEQNVVRDRLADLGYVPS
jgi:hypothetical protein